jgi:hypothetical protein
MNKNLGNDNQNFAVPQDRKSKVAHGIFFGSQEKYSKNIEQNVDKCSGFFEKINQIKFKNQNF